MQEKKMISINIFEDFMPEIVFVKEGAYIIGRCKCLKNHRLEKLWGVIP
jgi:hypothetical protein